MSHETPNWTTEDLLAQATWLDGLARRLVSDVHEAQDVAQETMIAALEGRRSSGSIRGWLATIARNVAIQRGRSERSRRARERSVARTESLEPESVSLDRARAQHKLTAAVLKLDEPYRSTVIRHYFDHLSVAEIAARQSVPESTVRTRLSRAVQTLREQFRREDGSEWMSAFAPLALGASEWSAHAASATTVAKGAGATTTVQTTWIGGASMATGWKVAIGVGLVLAIGWFARPEGDSVSTRHIDDGSSAHVASTEPTAASVSTTASALDATSPSGSANRSPVAGEVVAKKPTGVVVLGRVLDVDRRPLAKLDVSLRSIDAPWHPPEEPEFVPRGARATTDDEGRFRIETTLPSATQVTVSVTTDALQTAAEFDFDADDTRPLHRGIEDVGDLVVGSAGCVTGLVTCDGAPLANVRVRARNTLTQPGAVTTETGADGRFVLGHLAAGIATIDVHLAGFVAVTRTVGDVVVGERKDIGTIELARAASISGRVFDADGAPVAEALVMAYSTSGPGFASTSTDASGAFRVYLTQAGRHALRVEGGSTPLVPWGGKGAAHATFEPGTEGLRIVLAAMPTTEFHVVSAVDGAPIERFGLSVVFAARERDMRASDTDTPPIATHANGVLRTGAVPEQHVVRIAAPGFASCERAVAHDAPNGDVQTIRLVPEGRLVGLATRAGRPLENVTVRLERADDGNAWTVSASGGVADAAPPRLDAFAGRRRVTETDETGAFRFEGLAAGSYQLWMRTPEGSVESIDAIDVPATQTKDLGAIPLELGAVLRGTLVSAPASPVGWLLDFDGQAMKEIRTEDGRFEYGSVQPGRHKLRWWRSDTIGLTEPLRPEQGRSMTLEFVAGETKDVEIDARAQTPATLRVRVVTDGKPCAGAMLSLNWTESDGTRHFENRDQRTDVDGRATISIVGDSTVRVSASSPSSWSLGSSEEFALARGESRDVVIRSDTAELVVEFPAEFQIPVSGGFRVALSKPGTPDDKRGGCVFVTNEVFLSQAQGWWKDHRVALGRAIVGEYVVHCEVYELAAIPGAYVQRALIPSVERALTLKAGETTVIHVP